jgi:hypothetical protein
LGLVVAVRQFDEEEDAEQDKQGKADKMYLPVTLLFLFPEIHAVVNIQEEADNSDKAAQDTSRYQEIEIHVRCAWWKKTLWR